MAHFLREKAEECLRLARAMTDESASAKELIVMAASLHERAVKLEMSSVPVAGVEDPSQADDVAARSGAGTLAPGK